MNASQTALLVAAWRARATDLDEPFGVDRWAAQLAGDEGAQLARDNEEGLPHLGLYMAIRTEFIDQQVRRFIARGGKQVVILGAGLDTRAARLGAPGVRFFEVDQPASQKYKLNRLALLDDYPQSAATYVSCNFETDDFLDRGVAEGLDAGSPAFFVWEGVTYYLTEEAVRATLQRVTQGCHGDSVILFDTLGKKAVSKRGKSASVEKVHSMVGRFGEPFRFGVDDPIPLLFETGYRHVRTVSFDEACLHYTGTYRREREFRFQSLVIASPNSDAIL